MLAEFKYKYKNLSGDIIENFNITYDKKTIHIFIVMMNLLINTAYHLNIKLKLKNFVITVNKTYIVMVV